MHLLLRVSTVIVFTVYTVLKLQALYNVNVFVFTKGQVIYFRSLQYNMKFNSSYFFLKLQHKLNLRLQLAQQLIFANHETSFEV